jgi:hypothetical protein
MSALWKQISSLVPQLHELTVETIFHESKAIDAVRLGIVGNAGLFFEFQSDTIFSQYPEENLAYIVLSATLISINRRRTVL